MVSLWQVFPGLESQESAASQVGAEPPQRGCVGRGMSGMQADGCSPRGMWAEGYPQGIRGVGMPEEGQAQVGLAEEQIRHCPTVPTGSDPVFLS